MLWVRRLRDKSGCEWQTNTRHHHSYRAGIPLPRSSQFEWEAFPKPCLYNHSSPAGQIAALSACVVTYMWPWFCYSLRLAPRMMQHNPVWYDTTAVHSHISKQAKGLVNCVPPHCTVWSNHITVSCHMTHYITIWVAVTLLKRWQRARTSFSLLQKLQKHFDYTSWRACTLRNRYFKGALFEIWLHHLANCIPVGHSLYKQFTRPFLFSWKWVWLARLSYRFQVNFATCSGLPQQYNPVGAQSERSTTAVHKLIDLKLVTRVNITSSIQ